MIDHGVGHHLLGMQILCTYPQSVEEINIMCVVPYQQVVGVLTYAMVCTHFNLTFATGAVSQHSSNPKPTH
jgi:hypothetical protein